MMTTSFKQGDDKKLNLVIADTPAIDFSDATDIRVLLFVGDKEQYKYSREDMADHGKLTVDGSDKNVLHVYVERENSVSFDVGSMSATVIAVFDNSEFPDELETKTWDLNVGRVLAGRGLDEEI